MILEKISKSLIILIASTLLFLTVAPNVSVFAKNKDNINTNKLYLSSQKSHS